MEPPIKHYSKSSRQWDGILRASEYDTRKMLVRKVGQNGCIWIKQFEHYIGQSFTGEYVGITETEEGLTVSYGPISLRKLLNRNRRIEKPKSERKPIIRR